MSAREIGALVRTRDADFTRIREHVSFVLEVIA
jgi:hypothetical protein